MPTKRPVLFAAAALTLLAALPAQRPDAGRKSGLSRLEFEAIVLGGAPAAPALEIDGEIHDLAALRKRLEEAGVPPADVPRRMLDELVLGMLQHDLEKQKQWLADAAYDEAYAEYAKPYDTTPFTVKIIATRFKGYPDLETFQRRWRVQQSFVRTLPATTWSDEALDHEAELGKALLGYTGIEADLWFHEAKPQEDHRRDFAAATAAAAATREALAADPAAKLADAACTRIGEKDPVLFNPLRQQLRENEYVSLLREGVVEALYAAPLGELTGPLRGTDGVYIARVKRREDQPRAGNLVVRTNPKLRDLARQLGEQRRFLEWIDQVFARAVVRVPR